MSRPTILQEIHRRNGAEFVETGGWLLPVHFGAPLAEYAAVRSAVALLDRCDYGVLRVAGPDRVSYFQGMVSNDVKPLTPGDGVHAAVLDVNGKILADVTVLCAEECFLVLIREPLVGKILAHLKRYLVADDVEIKDESAHHGMVSLQGPHAPHLLSAIAPDQDPPVQMHGHRVLRVAEREIRAIRATHTGEEGFDLLMGVQDVVAVAEELQRAGAALACRWAGVQAQEILRVEAGLPSYGVDMTEENLLLETGLDDAVSFHKGCYLGQEVIERVHSRGHVNKKLVGITLGEDPVALGDKISSEGKEIGRVTSSVFSPKLARAIALGYVHRDYAQPAVSVAVESGGKKIRGAIAALPFVYSISP